MPKQQGIYFVVVGEQGPGVWFLHGAGGYHGVWLSYLRHLRQESRGLALDLPGHGQSDPLDLHDLEGYADALMRFWDQAPQVPLPPPEILVGHSLGGAIALFFALRLQDHGTPPRVLVLLGAAFRFPVHTTEPPQDRETLCKSLFQRPEWRRRCIESKELPLFTRPETLARDLQFVQRFDFRSQAKHLQSTVIWIHGGQDQVLPFAYVEESAQWARSHKIYIIPESGHMPHLEARGEVLRILKEVIHS